MHGLVLGLVSIHLESSKGLILFIDIYGQVHIEEYFTCSPLGGEESAREEEGEEGGDVLQRVLGAIIVGFVWDVFQRVLGEIIFEIVDDKTQVQFDKSEEFPASHQRFWLQIESFT